LGWSRLRWPWGPRW